eukprot:1183144-Prorocentrum_minimum.AAC.4
MARARTHTMPERPSQETLENVQMAGLHTLSLKCFTPVRGSHTRRPHSVEPETSMVAVSLTASEYTCKEGHRVQPAVSDLVDTAPLAFTLPESATPTSLIPPDGVASSQRAEVYQPYCTGGPVKRSNSIICRIAGVASQSARTSLLNLIPSLTPSAVSRSHINTSPPRPPEMNFRARGAATNAVT